MASRSWTIMDINKHLYTFALPFLLHINVQYIKLWRYTYKCRFGVGAIDYYPIKLEYHYTSVTKRHIFRFIVVEEDSLPEPRGLEAAQYCLLLPKRMFREFEVHRLVGLVRDILLCSGHRCACAHGSPY